jgi:hypothetical protein
MTAKKPDLDEPTRRIAERLLNMAPKQHKDMKLGKSKTKAKGDFAEPLQRRANKMNRLNAVSAPRFSIVRPINGDLIVLDRDAGIAKTVFDSGERDLWLHGSLEQSHAESLKAFYPNGEVRSER